MIYFKRFLWLAAWSVWLWLGFGLYRELPRNLGVPVCKLPVDSRDRIVGFVGETNHVAVIAAPVKSLQTFVRVFDAETGLKAGEVRAPWFQKFLLPYLDPVRKQFLFTREAPWTEGKEKNGLFVLDVSRLQWRRVSDWTTYAAVHHPTQPWLLFVGGAPSSSVTIPVVGFDYEAGTEIFRRNLPIWNLPEPAPFFAPGDRVAIPLRGPFIDPSKTAPRDVEVWTIGKPPTHQLTAKEIPIGRYADHVAAGRLGVLEQETWTVHVFDAVQGRLVFSQAASESATGAVRVGATFSGAPWFVSPVVSASGRRVIGGRPATLWDIDSGEIIWRSRGSIELAGPLDSDKFFRVLERWANLWRRWFPKKFDVSTVALRDLESGDLVVRTSERSLPLPGNWNATATLAVAADGAVYSLPPSVNWPLLALCQTILASPLVLLWAILGWRKRRAARRKQPWVDGRLPEAEASATPT